MRVFRVGVIGGGEQSVRHIEALMRMKQVQVVGLLDGDRERGRVTGEAAGVGDRVYENAEAFYREARPEVVHVLTPPQVRARVAVDALARGAHVLCEAPMALTAEQCQAMGAAAREYRRTLAVGHHLLYDPRVVHVRAMLARDVIGDVVHVETVRGLVMERRRHEVWDEGAEDARARWTAALPGGVMEELALPAVYVTLALLGHDAALMRSHALRSDRVAGVEADELRLMLSTAQATANVTVSLNMRPSAFVVTVYGTKGTVRLDVERQVVHHERADGRGRVMAGAMEMGQAARGVVMRAMGRGDLPGDPGVLFARFYGRLAADLPFAVGPEQGMRAVQMLRRIWPVPELRWRGEKRSSA